LTVNSLKPLGAQRGNAGLEIAPTVFQRPLLPAVDDETAR
jgi:hypothetical protein